MYNIYTYEWLCMRVYLYVCVCMYIIYVVQSSFFRLIPLVCIRFQFIKSKVFSIFITNLIKAWHFIPVSFRPLKGLSHSFYLICLIFYSSCINIISNVVIYNMHTYRQIHTHYIMFFFVYGEIFMEPTKRPLFWIFFVGNKFHHDWLLLIYWIECFPR